MMFSRQKKELYVTQYSDKATARLILAVALSLLVHAIILLIQLGEYGEGLPSFGLPNNNRHIIAPPLQVVIQPIAQPTKSLAPLYAELDKAPQSVESLPHEADKSKESNQPKKSQKSKKSKKNNTKESSQPVVEPKIAITPTNVPNNLAFEVRLSHPKQVDLSAVEVLEPIKKTQPKRASKTKIIASIKENSESFFVAVSEKNVNDALVEHEVKQNIEKEPPPTIKENDTEKQVLETHQAQKKLEQQLTEKLLAEKLAAENAKKTAEQEQRNTELMFQEAQQQAQLKAQELLAQQLADEKSKQTQQQAEQAKIEHQEKQRQKEARHQAELAALVEQQKVQAQEQEKEQEQEQQKRKKRQEKLEQSAAQKLLDEQIALRQKLQREIEKAEQERAQQAILTARSSLEIEQRKLDEAIRQDQLKREQERIQAQQVFEQKMAEQQRIQLEQQRIQQLEQQRLQQLAQQKIEQQKNAEQMQRQAEQQAELARAQQQYAQRQAALARMEREAQAGNKQRQGDNLDEILGVKEGRGEATNYAAGKGRNDALLGGPLMDLDKNRLRAQGTNEGQNQQGQTPPSSGRRSIFGSKNGEVGVNFYVQSWCQKVERNGRFNYSQSAKNHMYTDPIVVAAIRSDGSVESVTIVRSSGRADMDEAARRIVLMNAPYAKFPLNVARKYDVIDIRKIWVFDDALHLVDEM